VRLSQTQRPTFLQTQKLSQAPLRPFSASSWRRAEAEAAKEKDDAEKKTAERPQEEDPVAKELEAKKKEVLDLTVRRARHLQQETLR